MSYFDPDLWNSEVDILKSQIEELRKENLSLRNVLDKDKTRFVACDILKLPLIQV